MTGPLERIRILDLSIAATGPYAVTLLADQGADVVKVERPGIGDIGRWVGVSVNGMSALFLVLGGAGRLAGSEQPGGTGRQTGAVPALDELEALASPGGACRVIRVVGRLTQERLQQNPVRNL